MHGPQKWEANLQPKHFFSVLFCAVSFVSSANFEYATLNRPARRVMDSSSKTCPESLFDMAWHTSLTTTCPNSAGKVFTSDSWEELKALLPGYETDLTKLAAYAVNPKPHPWSKYTMSISMTDERQMALKKWLDSTEAAYPGLLDELCDPGPCQNLVPTKDCVDKLVLKDGPTEGLLFANEANFTRVLKFLQTFELCRARALYVQHSTSTTSLVPSETTTKGTEVVADTGKYTTEAPDTTKTTVFDYTDRSADMAISQAYSIQLSISVLSQFVIRMVWI